MNNEDNRLKNIAYKLRKSVLESLTAAGSGHLGGSLGMADIFTVLYFNILNHRPFEPNWLDRDRLILSNGHIAPILYASLAHAGYFLIDELKTLRQLGSRLQGHPGRNHGLPGLELSAGSLGQGVGVSVGMALAAKHLKKPYLIYCILGDGEMQEGSVWEAAMSAGHFKLDNLVWIIDRNRLQIDGDTEQVMSLEPLNDKLTSFNWELRTVDGHNIDDIQTKLSEKNKMGKPLAIIAKTIMGKGVPEIENNASWHGKVPTEPQLKDFLASLY
ncbi:MAG: transketolase [Bacteroidales bacterium]|nr:transketolase [Bacteroidales bacterium]